MGIKKYNPTTPARRQMTVSTFEEITGKSEIRTLMTNVKKNAGRNSYGRITVRHHGGGNKRQYRVVDFKRDKDGIPAKVASIEYDPNRSANIALVVYADGEKNPSLAKLPSSLKDAAELAQTSEFIKKYVPEEILSSYLKRAEK